MNISFRRRMVALSHGAIDAITFGLAAWIGLYAAQFRDGTFLNAASRTELRPLDVVILALGLLASTRFGSMPVGLRRLESTVAHLWMAARQSAVATATVLLPAVALGSPLLSSQGFVLGFAVALFGLRIIGRTALQEAMIFLRHRGRNLRIALVVGSGPRAARIVRDLDQHPEYGYFVQGFVDDRIHHPMKNLQHLGRIDELPRVLHQTRIDEVFVALPVRSHYDQILRTIELCEEQGIAVHLPGNLFQLEIAHAQSSTLASTPLISIVSSGKMDGLPYLLKRVFDRVAAALLILLLAPLMLAVALAIRVTMGSPVLFRQPRVGYRRRIFTCWKFRTMVNDAESKMRELEALNEADGPVFKIKNDPRVTPLGAFLRRTSIDELPQLFNVVLGEMSLVGPRPLPLRDVSRFDRASLNRRFSVWPGITCTWQVSGRSDSSFDEWIELDLEYLDTWSFSKDIEILVRTIGAVFKGKGAY